MVCTIYLGQKSNKVNLVIIPILLLTLLAGLRDRYVGTDTWTYTQPFNPNYDNTTLVLDANVEYGYQIFVYLINYLTNEYYWYLFIMALITVILMILAIRKYSIDYLLSIYIYITFGFYTFLFNTVRQAIALAILFYGVKFFLEKKLLKYILVVFIASLFHISAWVMLPFYFFIHFKLRVELKVAFTFISSLLASSVVIKYLSANNQRYEHYTQTSENAGGYLLLIFYSVIALALYVFGRNLRENNKSYNLLEQLYFCGLVFVIPITLLGTDPSGPQRVLYNFSVYLILLIPLVIKDKFNQLGYKILFYILGFVYFMMMTYSLYGIYPYELNDKFRIF